MSNDQGKFLVRVFGQELSLPNIALLMMLIAILIPAVSYSINLRNPTPAQLLIAVCIALFSSVVFLWILDATSVLRFHSAWVSKSVYGAAIVSVLGTSVAVYRDAFAGRKYLYEGGWQLSIQHGENDRFVADHTVVLIYSESATVYWGYSNIVRDGGMDKATWLEIKDFAPPEGNITVRLWFSEGSEKIMKVNCNVDGQGRLLKCDSEAEPKYKMTLSRLR